jgi:hypothetical protein
MSEGGCCDHRAIIGWPLASLPIQHQDSMDGSKKTLMHAFGCFMPLILALDNHLP